MYTGLVAQLAEYRFSTPAVIVSSGLIKVISFFFLRCYFLKEVEGSKFVRFLMACASLACLVSMWCMVFEEVYARRDP